MYHSYIPLDQTGILWKCCPHDWIGLWEQRTCDNVQECKEAAAGARRVENEKYDGQENKVRRRSPPSKKSNKSIEREQKFLEKVKTAATIVMI